MYACRNATNSSRKVIATASITGAKASAKLPKTKIRLMIASSNT